MALAAVHSIRQLPTQEVNSLRSDSVITGFAVAVEELVSNSLDAGATAVQASHMLLTLAQTLAGCAYLADIWINDAGHR